MAILTPRDSGDLCEIVKGAAAQGAGTLEVRGGGSKAEFGAPREATIVSMEGIRGVVDYDPAELVLTVRPGTPLAEVEALVAAEGQMLAFEPFDHGTVHGRSAGSSTIGGTVAAGIAGSRRITAGSARDHLLGFTAVSGRGETFVAGAKVVKNVTGYDLPKLMAGSWGRIGAMTELTLKVLPRPRKTVTLAAEGLSPAAAHEVMARALGSNADVSAAAHLQQAITLLRVAGFAPSVDARCAVLPQLLREHCIVREVAETEAAPLWAQAMTGGGLEGALLWQVHLPPRRAPDLVARLAALGSRWAMDWGGARVWIAHDEPDALVREQAESLGGEAMLVRAAPDVRARICAFHPRKGGVAALEQRVRRAFDPFGVFATTRFAEDARADQLSA